MKIICLILALFTSFKVPYYLNMSSIINVIIILITVCLYYFYKRQIVRISKRKGVFAFTFSFLFSIAYTIGKYFEQYKTIDGFNSFDNYLNLLALTIFIFFLTILIYTKLETNNLINRSKVLEKKKSYLLIFAIFLLILLPSYLAFFPGIVTVDGFDQLYMIYSNTFTAHHPLIHTLLLNGFYYFGNLFDNSNLGIALFSFLQMTLLALTFTYTIYIIYKYTKNKYLTIICIAFFIICPINSILMMYMTKDIIFSIIFLLFFDYTLIVILERPVTKRSYIIYLILGILMCLFRNQGIYIVTFSLLFTIIFYRSKKLILVLILIPLVTIGINKSLILITNAKSVNSAEMLSVPIQQLARAYNLNPDSFTNGDKKTLYKYIKKQSLEEYIPEISDPVKAKFNNEYFKKDKLSFIKLWLSIGLRNKTNYLDSFLYGSYVYFYLDAKLPHWGTLLPYNDTGGMRTEELFNIKISSYFNNLKKEKELDILNATYQDDFLKGITGSPALAFILLLFSVIYCLYKQNHLFLVPLSLILGMWGTIILGPVISIRYAYPLILCVPTLISVPFLVNKNDK